MAQLSKPAIPLKMYRHFAVVTVVLTAALALFADGENREAVADHMEEREQQAALARASEERFGPPQLVRQDEGSQAARFAGGGDDFDRGYGSPTTRPRNSSGTNVTIGTDPDGARALPGYSQEYLDSLSEQEYLQLVEMLQNAGLLDAAERRRNIAALAGRTSGRNGEHMELE